MTRLHFIDRTIPFLGFDTDQSQGSLRRFYVDFTSPIAIDSYRLLGLLARQRVKRWLHKAYEEIARVDP
jgi:hypothetical protein